MKFCSRRPDGQRAFVPVPMAALLGDMGRKEIGQMRIFMSAMILMLLVDCGGGASKGRTITGKITPGAPNPAAKVVLKAPTANASGTSATTSTSTSTTGDNILGSATVTADGSFTLSGIVVTGIVYPVLIVEDGNGRPIAVIGNPTGSGGEIAHYFPVDGEGNGVIALGDVTYRSAGSEVLFVPDNSPALYVDTDHDGKSDYAEDLPVNATAEQEASAAIRVRVRRKASNVSG